MKHLLSIMAVFLLMGCQTTDTTPKDTISPEKVVKEEKLQMPPMELANPIIVHKPLLCGESSLIVSGIFQTHKEQPVGWFESKKVGAGGADHKVLIMANTEEGTVTILEYINPDVACFLAVGTEFEMVVPEKSEKTKGHQIKYKKALAK